MRLLLDEMYWPALAEQLVARGHDVSAAVDRPELSGIPDEQVFAAAQRERRAVFTENVGDYVPIHAHCVENGIAHHGLILAAARAYPRDRANGNATLGRLVNDLDALLNARPGEDADSFYHWL